MRADWSEGRLEFDFSGALQTCQPDMVAAPLSSMAPPLKSMDFYVWFSKSLWFIEVKDPEGANPGYVPQAKKEVWSEILNDQLLKEHLLPKLFGAYAHLTFEKLDLSGPIHYGILIGLTDLSEADRNILTDKIERVIQKIGPKLRHGKYWPQPEVHNIASWNIAHPEMQITQY